MGDLGGQDQIQWTHLGRQHKGLHELPHGLHVVRQLAHHLHHYALVQGGVGVHVADLGVAVAETQGHHPLMDLLQMERERSEKVRGSLTQNSVPVEALNRNARLCVCCVFPHDVTVCRAPGHFQQG